MSQTTDPPFIPGEQVRVVQNTASDAIKQRLYKVVKYMATYEMLQLEWVDAPQGSKEKYFWVLKDFVRRA